MSQRIVRTGGQPAAKPEDTRTPEQRQSDLEWLRSERAAWEANSKR